MKIIDLLNKIANGEEYSKKARIRYFDRQNDYEDECILTIFAIGYRLHNAIFDLNDEVEVIEEDKKIEKITLDDWAEITYSEDWKLLTYDFNRNSNLFVDKINEIIDKVNKENK